MNYINLTLGGKERGAKLGLLFLENAQKAENMNIQELFVELQMRSIFFAPKLIFHALNTNCQLKGETPDFTLENVYDWIEEDGVSNRDGVVMKFVNAFSENIQKLFPTENANEEGKQKPTKKDSTPTSGSKK